MTLLLAAVLAASPYGVLTPGAHHGGSVKNVGQGWLGLFPTRLSPVTLVLTPVHDAIDDEGKPETVRSGLQVSAAGDPQFLLKGLAPREVSPISSSPTSLAPEKPVAIAEATLSVEPVDQGHRLVFTQGTARQVLYQQAEGDLDGWQLLWAGDLDGDGKPDLIVAADHHYNLSTTRLFLSSKAKKGQLVAEVAKFTVSGC